MIFSYCKYVYFFALLACGTQNHKQTQQIMFLDFKYRHFVHEQTLYDPLDDILIYTEKHIEKQKN